MSITITGSVMPFHAFGIEREPSHEPCASYLGKIYNEGGGGWEGKKKKKQQQQQKQKQRSVSVPAQKASRNLYRSVVRGEYKEHN
jgi:hypothetical protein